MSGDARSPLHLFAAVGVELEHMLVDRDTLDVLPASDQLLAAANAGVITGDVERDRFGWSNELVLHVLELKTNGPAPLVAGAFAELAAGFAAEVRAADELAAASTGRILGTAMHPWMDPLREARLWPHEYNAVYAAFDRLFDARGHGWSNLQSMHLNLPFVGDEEFGALHAAIRLVLPLLPGLAASSPVMDGGTTGRLDNRLEVYRHNARRIPQIAGAVIPEPAFSESEYRARIFDPLMAAIAPHDPDGIFEEEWLNARGAIARFARGSIEIRVIDVQEAPAMDLAIAELVVATLRALVEERWGPRAAQRPFATERLATPFLAAVRDAEQAWVDDADYLAQLGVMTTPGRPLMVGEVWRRLAAELIPADAACRPALDVLLTRGTLARRILGALDADPGHPGAVAKDRLRAVYGRLADCLRANRPFGG